MTDALDWLQAPIPHADAAAAQRARAHQGQLTKPPGSLGELEQLVVRLAGLQKHDRPTVERVHIAIFAADHGVAVENVSAFPQDVTGQMIDNFAGGGAAIAVLARELGAVLEVIDLGTVRVSTAGAPVRRERIASMTANLATGAAMTPLQFAAALKSGRDSAARAQANGAQLFIGGDMGIANTTSATALACAFLDAAPAELAGAGTGLDREGVSHKARVIERALATHREHLHTPPEVLRRLGGFEIVALTGAYIACAQLGIPVLVDGFIATAAALSAVRIAPAAGEWLLFAHRSAEQGHARLLAALDARPMLDIGMRLGEGSGAAVAVPLLRLACALHAQMATFAQAGVSTGDA